MALGARDPIVEKPTQVVRAARGRMRPKYDNVGKLAVLGALDCHYEIATLLPEPQAQTVAHGFPHELGNLRRSEARLPVRPAQAIHTVNSLRDDPAPSKVLLLVVPFDANAWLIVLLCPADSWARIRAARRLLGGRFRRNRPFRRLPRIRAIDVA
jgi:hypothetical protein